MVPETFTGAPDNLVGEKRACLAASTAASRSGAGPERAVAEITAPLSSTMTCTSTLPEVLERRAMSGYLGTGKLSAFPFSTPPETGLSNRGGGASPSLLTTGLPEVEFARLAPGTCTAENRALSADDMGGSWTSRTAPVDGGSTFLVDPLFTVEVAAGLAVAAGAAAESNNLAIEASR